ncbi:hypothetical protein SSS_04803 [Sarcoptes scabiei]|uniref:Cyclin-dependent kinase inhibitor domain-containing protein n=1 Tax=Sarcoptes scabiei TaxID=52283 RepID=A0A834RDE5_SARSC|nr:hypothetical protein SSS_04803 [Sarcoptes scabiei]
MIIFDRFHRSLVMSFDRNKDNNVHSDQSANQPERTSSPDIPSSIQSGQSGVRESTVEHLPTSSSACEISGIHLQLPVPSQEYNFDFERGVPLPDNPEARYIWQSVVSSHSAKESSEQSIHSSVSLSMDPCSSSTSTTATSRQASLTEFLSIRANTKKYEAAKRSRSSSNSSSEEESIIKRARTETEDTKRTDRQVKASQKTIITSSPPPRTSSSGSSDSNESVVIKQE